MDHSMITMDHAVITMDHSMITMDHSMITMDHSMITMDHLVITTDHFMVTSDHSMITTDHSDRSNSGDAFEARQLFSKAALYHPSTAGSHAVIPVLSLLRGGGTSGEEMPDVIG